MSEPQKIQGIVVRSVSYRDNDKMLTVLSKEHGVVSVCAKGVKSLKNQNGAACAPLCYSNMILKPVGDNYSLSSADVIESFYPLRESVEALSYGAYFASLTAMCVGEGNPCGEELRLLLNTLYILTKYPERGYIIRAVFELKLCELVGVAPIIAPCACGKEAGFFNFAEGECTCALHKGEASAIVSKNAMAVMEYIYESDLKKALTFDTDRQIASEVSDLMEKFMKFQFGRLPRSLEYLKNIIK